MKSEKQTVERLYTSGSADFVDSEGDVRPIADFDDGTMEFSDEEFPRAYLADTTAVVSLKRAVLGSRKHKRPDRRGGRSCNEGSDSELDPNWNVPIRPLTPEQQAINRRGIALTRVALRFSSDQIEFEQTNGC